MNMLVAHISFLHLGGEDVVVEAEVALLRDLGQHVQLLERSNDELAKISPLAGATQTMWSRRTTSEVGALIDQYQPDIVHVHNTFALLSPSLYWACAKAGVPVVQTLHNFRIVCPQAMLLREGRICEACVGRVPVPAIIHGCYRGSRAQTAVLSAMVTLHRGLGTWQNKVARYIALNEFCRGKFIQAGLPAERIVVKPNFVNALHFNVMPRTGFLFVGRLSPEKGVKCLSDAIKNLPDSTLKVIGHGPESAWFAQVSNVRSMGERSRDVVFKEMNSALALIVPSIWYETFGLVVAEAFANGLPVIASRIGALAEIVQDGLTGLLFNPGDSVDLARVLAWAESHPDDMAGMGRRARLDYEARFSPERNIGQLLDIYRAAIEASST